ncbi:MAG: hypothetical protein DBY17_05250 [Oscillospiraceae bacterium]|nr:MAG: hypothetical protein DBY17_05250 [Oscillospiraceae bacterium]
MFYKLIIVFSEYYSIADFGPTRATDRRTAMEKKREQDFADLEVKRLCGVFGTPIPALPPERERALDKGQVSVLCLYPH